MSLRNLYMVFAGGSLIMSFVFFIQLILLIPDGFKLWPYFVLYWAFTFTASVIFIIRAETEIEFRTIAKGD